MQQKELNIMSIIMLCLALIDVILTYIGINKGYEEGNYFIADLITYVGLSPALIIIFIATGLFLIGVCYYSKKYPFLTSWLYYAVLLSVIFRVFIIGIWIGAIFG